MGRQLGTLYNKLWNETSWLHHKWEEYVELYGTKPERIDLLNRAAPGFFRLVEVVLFEETLLHISRLTDGESIGKKGNLTIRRLSSCIDDAELAIEVAKLIETADQKTAFCRDWRNRRIAHSDLDLALNKGAEPLKSASRKKVREALDSIAAVLNALSGHYFRSENFFRGTGGSRGAHALLYVIDDGMRAADQRHARIVGRTPTREDVYSRRAL